MHDLAARPRGRRSHRRRAAAILLCLSLVLAGAAGGLFGADRDGAQPAQASKAATAHAVRPPLTFAVGAPRPRTPGWTVVATVDGAPAVWTSTHGRVQLMRMDGRLVRLDLHAGWNDGGIRAWRYGDRIGGSEAHRLIAAFNGGFKFPYKDTGFMAEGHQPVPLRPGLGSIVTYQEGATNIGAWGEGVPSRHAKVFSVLQNQHLLVDHGVAAANTVTCVQECWGGTIGYVNEVARSGLGITADGYLVWAAGEHLSPLGLARALIGEGAVRAVELDINPWWVEGYVYVHHDGAVRPVGLVRGQRGIGGRFFAKYSRDFFAVVAR